MQGIWRKDGMLFNSVNFLIFFPVVVLIYFLMPKKVKYVWLLAASYFFYMCWNAKYALLLLWSTAITYLSGLLIDRCKFLERSMGPATNCGKKDTNNAYFKKFRST